MQARTTRSRLWLNVLGTLTLGATGIAACAAADRFDMAVDAQHRSSADAARDANDHTAALLRLTGIGPRMHVADVLAGDGYYSEVLGQLVGPQGHVLMINNSSFDKWSDGDRQKRLAGNRLPNVEYQVVDLDHMKLAAGSLDAIVLSKVYHDLYWVDTSGEWPKFDTAGVLDQLAKALKPGGVLLLIDHSAKAGHGSADASTLHRIDEQFARHDFEQRGLRLVAHSDLLRRADDPRDLVSYKPPMLGKTDRFVLVFRKGRQ
ncbi:MAG: class I SAM-dependent methyltransferase [Proteobacteria bacterium]|nr:class I SAM-dependent methyltransferase [Pseudomonadota bacterium]